MSRMRLMGVVAALACLAAPGAAAAQAAWTYLVTDARGNAHHWRPAGRGAEQTAAWVRISQRVELSSPLVIGAMSYRSMLYAIEFDCAGSRYREVGLTGFTQPNLGGTRVDAAPRSEWHAVGSNDVTTVLEPAACWTHLVTSGNGDVIKAIRPFPSPANPAYRMISTLQDYRDPMVLGTLTIRSVVIDSEVDCSSFNFRNTTTVFFGGQGATGQYFGTAPSTAWSTTQPGSTNRAIAEAACR